MLLPAHAHFHRNTGTRPQPTAAGTPRRHEQRAAPSALEHRGRVISPPRIPATGNQLSRYPLIQNPLPSWSDHAGGVTVVAQIPLSPRNAPGSELRIRRTKNTLDSSPRVLCTFRIRVHCSHFACKHSIRSGYLQCYCSLKRRIVKHLCRDGGARCYLAAPPDAHSPDTHGFSAAINRNCNTLSTARCWDRPPRDDGARGESPMSARTCNSYWFVNVADAPNGHASVSRSQMSATRASPGIVKPSGPRRSDVPNTRPTGRNRTRFSGWRRSHRASLSHRPPGHGSPARAEDS